MAWATDQAYIASEQEPGSESQRRFADRAEALRDAARDILTADIWSVASFMREDGTYPPRDPSSKGTNNAE